MELNTENKLIICRLCLQTSDDVVNIWNTFQNTTIASVVSKHFWFEIDKVDGLTEWLCQTCWMKTKSFHEFYKQIELFQKSFLESADSFQKDISVEKASTDTSHAAPEHYLDIVKSEENEVRLETFDSHMSSGDSSQDEEGETDDKLENEEKSVNNEQKSDGEDGRAVLRKGWLSSSEQIELEGQIRELFNMKCEFCSDVEFSTLLKAKQHYSEVHKTEGYITCCGKKFIRQYEVVRHIRHHMFNPDAQPSNELESRVHELFNMKCEICIDVNFDTLPQVRRHYRQIHKTKGYITCCGRKFFNRSRILQHVRCHINPDEHHCEQCNRSFTTAKSLKSHIENHIPLDSRKFKCNLCSSSFNKEYPLKLHIQQKHTSKTGEKFPCDKCGKNFRSSLLLYCHIRQLHTLAQEYVCEVCARTFKNKYTLQQHTKSEHSSTPPPKVRCDICGVWVKFLKAHRNLHNETKPIRCPICNKESRNKHNLDQHIAYVHGEKRFPCNLCDKAFKSSKNLKDHIAIHTGEDLYNCQYCDKKFKSNANMYSHRKKAHLAEWTRDFSKPKM